MIRDNLRHRSREVGLLQSLDDLSRKSGLVEAEDGLRDDLLPADDRDLGGVPESIDLLVRTVLEKKLKGFFLILICATK